MIKNKIKVCHIVSRITGRADGIFKHLIAQFTLLDQNTFEHYLVCPFSKEIEEETKRNKINTFFVDEIDTSSYFKALIKIKRVIDNNNFDVICCHTLKPLVFGGYLSIFKKSRIIFFSHGIFLNNDYNSFAEKIIYKFLFKILFSIKKVIVLSPSKWNLKKLKSELGNRFQSFVYYDGEAVLSSEGSKTTNNKIEKLLANDKSRVKIIFVGRLAREKDPILAAKIFEELNRDDLSLHFFGEGELEKVLIEFIQMKKLRNVFIHGYQRNVSDYFDQFDLLILTSKREGMPIVIWEAMNAGLPFVSKNVGDISEILKYGKCGFVFETQSDAIEIIRRLTDDPELLRELKREGPRILKEHFHKQNFVNFFSKIYLEHA